MTTVLESTITCPACGTASRETMPTDACLYFYECAGCKTLLKPKPGDCCVFCSYGSVPCPPIQQCCGGSVRKTADASWSFCTLDRDAFADRMTEIDSLVARFAGRAQTTDEGVKLVFAAQDDLRAALDTLIAKERQCCGTLAFMVEEGDGRTSLRISAPQSDRGAVQALAARLAASGRSP